MRRMMIWTAAVTMAFAGATFAQSSPAAQQQVGDQARIHQPTEGKGLGKEQAKIAKKQKKQAEKAAKRAAKAERKANEAAMARAKKVPGNGTGNMGSGPRDGTGPQAIGGQARGQGGARGGRGR